MFWLQLLGIFIVFSALFTFLRLALLKFVYKDGLVKAVEPSSYLNFYDALAKLLPGFGPLYIMISNNLAEKLAIIDPEIRKTMEADRELQSKVQDVLNEAKQKKRPNNSFNSDAHSADPH
jgi:hypothetical protein